MIGLTLGQMLGQIRVEAELKDDLELENYVVIKANEVLRSFTSLDRYTEFLVVNYPLIVVSTGQTTFTLPADYQHFDAITLNGNEFYFISNLKKAATRKRNHARISGSNLIVSYYNDLTSSDTLLLSYYKAPDLLTTLSTVFPIPLLCNLVCLKTAAEIAGNTNGAKAKILNDRVRDEYRMVRASR